jgi:hypothetical protein
MTRSGKTVCHAHRYTKSQPYSVSKDVNVTRGLRLLEQLRVQ